MNFTHKNILHIILIATILFASFTFVHQLLAKQKDNHASKINRETAKIEERTRDLIEQNEKIIDKNYELTLELEKLALGLTELDDDDDIAITEETIDRLKSDIKKLKDDPTIISLLSDEEIVDNIMSKIDGNSNSDPELAYLDEYTLRKTDHENVLTFSYNTDDNNQRDFFVAGPWAMFLAHYEDLIMSSTFNMYPIDDTFNLSPTKNIDLYDMFETLIDDTPLQNEEGED